MHAESPKPQDILVQQRRNRPVSPHLSIYRPQITWIASGLNRITGVAISGLMYLYFMGYALGPMAGLHLESTVLAASFAAWPLVAKIAAKTAVAMPFMFHCWNSIRHLVWDAGMGFAKGTVIKSGWSIVAATVVSTLYVVFGY